MNTNPIISTFTNLQLEINAPQTSQICIEDIAHGLSQICRFAGQCTPYYSVAQHSVFVSRHVPQHLALTGLLHDASEAYMGDLHSGLKKIIPQYKEIEDRLLAVIYQKFGIPTDTLKPAEVKMADELSLIWESRHLDMDIQIDFSHPHVQDPFVALSSEQAEQNFLQRFRELQK